MVLDPYPAQPYLLPPTDAKSVPADAAIPNRCQVDLSIEPWGITSRRRNCWEQIDSNAQPSHVCCAPCHCPSPNGAFALACLLCTLPSRIFCPGTGRCRFRLTTTMVYCVNPLHPCSLTQRQHICQHICLHSKSICFFLCCRGGWKPRTTLLCVDPIPC